MQTLVYVGETERQIRERMTEHVRDARLMKDKIINGRFGQNHYAAVRNFIKPIWSFTYRKTDKRICMDQETKDS